MRTVLIVIVVLVVLFFALSYLIYRRVFHERDNRKRDKYILPKGAQYEEDKQRMLRLIGMLDEIPYEEVWTEAYDGTALFGRYYHVKDGAPVHIQMHGYRGFGIRDFCGGNRIAREMGHNTLIIDQRAHGKSKGRTMTFGVKEHRDCISWISYVQKRSGEETPVFLSGVSMGAATVLLAAGSGLPFNVAGVIADCPYSSAKEIICKVCEDMKLPAGAVFPFIRFSARLFGGFDPLCADVAGMAGRIRIPVLLIHGEADLFVPHEMSRKICDANPEKIRLEIFPGAGHGISYIVDTERYTQVSVHFIEGCLKERA